MNIHFKTLPEQSKCVFIHLNPFLKYKHQNGRLLLSFLIMFVEISVGRKISGHV